MNYSDFCKFIGSKISSFRILKDKSMSDVASFLNVPISTVTNWELGIDAPSMYQFFLLMNFLDFSLYDL